MFNVSILLEREDGAYIDPQICSTCHKKELDLDRESSGHIKSLARKSKPRAFNVIVLPGVSIQGKSLCPPLIGTVHTINIASNSPYIKSYQIFNNLSNNPACVLLDREKNYTVSNKKNKSRYLTNQQPCHSKAAELSDEIKSIASNLPRKSISWNEGISLKCRLQITSRKTRKRLNRGKIFPRRSVSTNSFRAINQSQSATYIHKYFGSSWGTDHRGFHKHFTDPRLCSTLGIPKSDIETCNFIKSINLAERTSLQDLCAENIEFLSVTYDMEEPVIAGESHSVNSLLDSQESGLDYDPLYKCAFQFAKSRGYGFVEFVEESVDVAQPKKNTMRKKVNMLKVQKDDRNNPVCSVISAYGKNKGRHDKCMEKPKVNFIGAYYEKSRQGNTDREHPHLKCADDMDKMKAQSPTLKTSCPDLMKEHSTQKNRHRIHSKTTSGTARLGIESPEESYDIIQSSSLGDIKENINNKSQKGKRKYMNSYESVSTRSKSIGVGDVLHISKTKTGVDNASFYQNKSAVIKATGNAKSKELLQCEVKHSKNKLHSRESRQPALDTNTSKTNASDSDEKLCAVIPEAHDDEETLRSESNTILPQLGQKTSLQYKLCNSISATIFRETQLFQKAFVDTELLDQFSHADVDLIHFSYKDALCDENCCPASSQYLFKKSSSRRRNLKSSQYITETCSVVGKNCGRRQTNISSDAQHCYKWKNNSESCPALKIHNTSDLCFKDKIDSQACRSNTASTAPYAVGVPPISSQCTCSVSVEVRSNVLNDGIERCDPAAERCDPAAERCDTAAEYKIPDESCVRQVHVGILERENCKLHHNYREFPESYDLEATESSPCTSRSSEESVVGETRGSILENNICQCSDNCVGKQISLNNNKNEAACKDYIEHSGESSCSNRGSETSESIGCGDTNNNALIHIQKRLYSNNFRSLLCDIMRYIPEQSTETVRVTQPKHGTVSQLLEPNLHCSRIGSHDHNIDKCPDMVELAVPVPFTDASHENQKSDVESIMINNSELDNERIQLKKIAACKGRNEHAQTCSNVTFNSDCWKDQNTNQQKRLKQTLPVSQVVVHQRGDHHEISSLSTDHFKSSHGIVPNKRNLTLYFYNRRFVCKHSADVKKWIFIVNTDIKETSRITVNNSSTSRITVNNSSISRITVNNSSYYPVEAISSMLTMNMKVITDLSTAILGIPGILTSRGMENKASQTLMNDVVSRKQNLNKLADFVCGKAGILDTKIRLRSSNSVRRCHYYMDINSKLGGKFQQDVFEGIIGQHTFVGKIGHDAFDGIIGQHRFVGKIGHEAFDGTLEYDAFDGTLEYDAFDGTLEYDAFDGTLGYNAFDVKLGQDAFEGKLGQDAFQNAFERKLGQDAFKESLCTTFTNCKISNENADINNSGSKTGEHSGNMAHGNERKVPQGGTQRNEIRETTNIDMFLSCCHDFDSPDEFCVNSEHLVHHSYPMDVEVFRLHSGKVNISCHCSSGSSRRIDDSNIGVMSNMPETKAGETLGKELLSLEVGRPRESLQSTLLQDNSHYSCSCTTAVVGKRTANKNRGTNKQCLHARNARIIKRVSKRLQKHISPKKIQFRSLYVQTKYKQTRAKSVEYTKQGIQKCKRQNALIKSSKICVDDMMYAKEVTSSGTERNSALEDSSLHNCLSVNSDQKLSCFPPDADNGKLNTAYGSYQASTSLMSLVLPSTHTYNCFSHNKKDHSYPLCQEEISGHYSDCHLSNVVACPRDPKQRWDYNVQMKSNRRTLKQKALSQQMKSFLCTNNNNSNKCRTIISRRKTAVKKSKKHGQKRYKTREERVTKTTFLVTPKGRKLLLKQNNELTTYIIGPEGHKSLYKLLRRRYKALQSQISSAEKMRCMPSLCCSCHLIDSIVGRFRNLITMFPETRLRTLHRILGNNTKQRSLHRRIARKVPQRYLNLSQSHCNRVATRGRKKKIHYFQRACPAYPRSVNSAHNVYGSNTTSVHSFNSSNCCQSCTDNNLETVDSLIIARDRLARKRAESMSTNMSKNACYLETSNMMDRFLCNNGNITDMNVSFLNRSSSRKPEQTVTSNDKKTSQNVDLDKPLATWQSHNEASLRTYLWPAKLIAKKNSSTPKERSTVTNAKFTEYNSSNENPDDYLEQKKKQCHVFPRNSGTSSHLSYDASWIDMDPSLSNQKNAVCNSSEATIGYSNSCHTHVPNRRLNADIFSSKTMSERRKHVSEKSETSLNGNVFEDIETTAMKCSIVNNKILQLKSSKTENMELTKHIMNREENTENKELTKHIMNREEKVNVMQKIVSEFFTKFTAEDDKEEKNLKNIETRKEKTSLVMDDGIWKGKNRNSNDIVRINLDTVNYDSKKGNNTCAQGCFDLSLAPSNTPSLKPCLRNQLKETANLKLMNQNSHKNETGCEEFNKTANHLCLSQGECSSKSMSINGGDVHEQRWRFDEPYLKVNSSGISTKWICFAPKLLSCAPNHCHSSSDSSGTAKIDTETSPLSFETLAMASGVEQVNSEPEGTQQSAGVSDQELFHCTVNEMVLKRGLRSAVVSSYSHRQHSTRAVTTSSSSSSSGEECNNNNSVNKRSSSLTHLGAPHIRAPQVKKVNKEPLRSRTKRSKLQSAAKSHIRNTKQVTLNFNNSSFSMDNIKNQSCIKQRLKNMSVGCKFGSSRLIASSWRRSLDVKSNNRKRSIEEPTEEATSASKMAKLSLSVPTLRVSSEQHNYQDIRRSRLETIRKRKWKHRKKSA